MRIAVIGGTGLYDLGLPDTRYEEVPTPYGPVRLGMASHGPVQVLFLARHGEKHLLAPHRINYRANLWALKRLGAERIIATGAVGSLRTQWAPGQIVLVDQFVDFTRNRPVTFGETEEGVRHLDFTEPYCPQLREILARTAEELGWPVRLGGVYVCTEGPRYETPAEIRAFRRLGGDLVGMTSVPEVVLAREAGLCYALVALVTNFAAGLSRTVLTHAEVLEIMTANLPKVRTLVLRAIEKIPGERKCRCGTAEQDKGAAFP